MNSNRRKFLQDSAVMMALIFAGGGVCAASKSLPHSCALKGNADDYDIELLKTSGNRDLDRSLNLELGHLADSFEVLPGFGFFDDRGRQNAFATPASRVNGTKDGTVILGKTFLSTELSRHKWGGLAVAGIMAHEFAHIYQFESHYYSQLSQTTDKLLELHADYLAGYYLGMKRLRTREEFDIKAFKDSLYIKGDTNFNSRHHHGTPTERIDIMIKGYKQGLTGDINIHKAASAGFNLVKNS